MMSSARFTGVALIALLLQQTQARFAITGFNNVAVYWGQNSYGQASGGMEQKRLSEYCADTNVDIIPMAFLYQMTTGTGGEPVINFANQGNNCEPFPGTNLLNCPDIGADITTCQTKYNKTILLSVGGATYTEGGFTSPDQAKSMAIKMWETFGPPPTGAADTSPNTASSTATAPLSTATAPLSTATAPLSSSTASPSTNATYTNSTSPAKRQSTALRPFGTASIDGFDLDFESTTTNMVTFAQTLRSLMDAQTQKPYYLTAAPQCVYPDAADNEMLNGTVAFDAIFVQFYNNYCGIQSYVADAAEQNNFNFAVWDNWAKTVSKNPDVKVLLGVPAGQTAAGSGYLSVDKLAAVIDYCKTFDSFGGIMAWDLSQAYANDGFLPGARSSLLAAKRRMIRGMTWRK